SALGAAAPELSASAPDRLCADDAGNCGIRAEFVVFNIAQSEEKMRSPLSSPILFLGDRNARRGARWRLDADFEKRLCNHASQEESTEQADKGEQDDDRNPVQNSTLSLWECLA